MEKKKYLMPGVGRYWTCAIESVQKYGGYVICTDFNPDAEAFKYADEHRVMSVLDKEAMLDLAKSEKVDGIIATSESSVMTVTYVANTLGLRCGIAYENALCAIRKDLMRKRLSEHQVPIPHFVVCEDFSAFEKAVQGFGFDCVSKPADSASSKGVTIVNQDHNLQDLPAIYEYSLSFSRSGIVLVEERVYGPEVSVESMTINGETTVLVITDKLLLDPPYTTEMGHTQPSRLPGDIQEQIVDVTKRTVAAIGLANGPSHAELKITDRGPVLIEIGVRPGGDYITSKLVPMSTGFDFIDASMRIAMGMNVNIETQGLRGAAIRFITADRDGIIDSIDIDDSIQEINGFVELHLYCEAGEKMEYPRSSEWRIGYVLCGGKDADAAAAAADEALSRVHVTMRD